MSPDGEFRCCHLVFGVFCPQIHVFWGPITNFRKWGLLIASNPHFRKFVNMAGALFADRWLRQYVTLIFGNLRTAVFLSQHTVFPPCSENSENEGYIWFETLIFRNLRLFTHRSSKYMYLRAKYTEYKMAKTKFSIWRYVICEICKKNG